MEDSNTIAWLSPTEPEDKSKVGKYTWEAIRMNISQDNPPQGETVSDYRSRESTAPLEDKKDQATYPELYLAFNSGLKYSHGLIFETDPNNCNVVLPRLRSISNRYYYLTFDTQRRLVLRDYSTYRTIVEYNGQRGELHCYFI